MHELGIAQAALQQTLERAQEAGARRVTRLVVRVGALSGVEPEALRFALEAIRPGTLAAEAAIEIDTVPAMARCDACACEFAPGDEFIFSCPSCQRLSTTLTRGRELELAQLEID